MGTLFQQLLGTNRGAQVQQKIDSVLGSPIVQTIAAAADPTVAADIQQWGEWFDTINNLPTTLPAPPSATPVAPEPPPITGAEIDSAIATTFAQIGAPADLVAQFETSLAANLAAAGHPLPT
jgi:hypothetical protein